jgi:vacuolar-type H+-ATPase subunit E/Vma4
MYTGTTIRDLMAAVERAERRAEQRADEREAQKRTEEELELQAILAMQIPVMEGKHIFVGAA